MYDVFLKGFLDMNPLPLGSEYLPTAPFILQQLDRRSCLRDSDWTSHSGVQGSLRDTRFEFLPLEEDFLGFRRIKYGPSPGSRLLALKSEFN